MGILCVVCAVGVLVVGTVTLWKISLAAEVYSHELIAEGMVDTAKVQSLLDEAGLPFDAESGKETGLGAYIVRESDMIVAHWAIRLSAGLLLISGVALLVAAFGAPECRQEARSEV